MCIRDSRVGDLVYLYSDRDKNAPRNRYLVTSVELPWCYIRKFVGETIRANTYKVKRTEVYKVPTDPTLAAASQAHVQDVSDSDENITAEAHNQAPAAAAQPSIGAAPQDDPPIPCPTSHNPSQPSSVPPTLPCEEPVAVLLPTEHPQQRHASELTPTRSPARAYSSPRTLSQLPEAPVPVQQPSVPVELSAPVATSSDVDHSVSAQTTRRNPPRQRRRPAYLSDYCE